MIQFVQLQFFISVATKATPPLNCLLPAATVTRRFAVRHCFRFQEEREKDTNGISVSITNCHCVQARKLDIARGSTALTV